MNVQPKKSSRTEVDRCDSVLLRMSIQIGNIGSQWKKTIEISQTQYFFTLVKIVKSKRSMFSCYKRCRIGLKAFSRVAIDFNIEKGRNRTDLTVRLFCKGKR